MLTRSRARSIGWAVILGLCFALTMALTFRVNAVKSQVRLTERKIVALRMQNGLLETEFETRANQQQLRSLNDVEFGYQAPTAGQYLENERDLALLGKPVGPGAPEMIRVAHADAASAEKSGDSILPHMVNPLTGKALAAEMPASERHPAERSSSGQEAQLPKDKVHTEKLASAKTTAAKGTALVERLSHVERAPLRIKSKVAIEE